MSTPEWQWYWRHERERVFCSLTEFCIGAHRCTSSLFLQFGYALTKYSRSLFGQPRGYPKVLMVPRRQELPIVHKKRVKHWESHNLSPLCSFFTRRKTCVLFKSAGGCWYHDFKSWKIWLRLPLRNQPAICIKFKIAGYCWRSRRFRVQFHYNLGSRDFCKCLMFTILPLWSTRQLVFPQFVYFKAGHYTSHH